MTLTGTRVPRKEDPRLLRGRGAFTDAFHARGELWARVVRSPVAHGTLRTVDVAKAKKAAGVTTVVTAADLPPGLAIPIRLVLRDLPLTDYLQPVLAAGVVRYVGEPLAVVLAEDAYTAEDAAELVDIDIDPLPAVLDAAAAAAGGVPLLFPAGNVAADFSMGYGDTEAGFARAAHVTETAQAVERSAYASDPPDALLAAEVRDLLPAAILEPIGQPAFRSAVERELAERVKTYRDFRGLHIFLEAVAKELA